MATPPSKHQGSGNDLDAFLEKVKSMPASVSGASGRGRLIFALDATMSRQPTWDIACQIQGDMFTATREIGGLDVQLLYFRGYRECKAGKWQPDARGIARQMSSVHCQAGRTQIGRVLSHAIQENEKHKIGAMVFVGDAFEEDIDTVCHTAGELGLMGVPVFTFQEGVDPIAQRAFKEIARLTSGAWCPFDLSSPSRLKALLSAVAVYAAGGIKALEDLGRRDSGQSATLLLEQLRGGGKRQR